MSRYVMDNNYFANVHSRARMSGNSTASNSQSLILDRPPSRPPSELLCDLHVYKVPADLWRETFNNITNNVVTETVSIGIIRVPSETKLVDLREEIIQQLQPDDLGPRDWVFLRSVGRCLTRLRTKQEYQLKAKHFLPPVSFAPELYILEATPEVRDALAISERGSSQSPPLSRRTSPSHRAYPNSYRNGYAEDSGPKYSGRKPASPVHKHTALPHIQPTHDRHYHNYTQDNPPHDHSGHHYTPTDNRHNNHSLHDTNRHDDRHDTHRHNHAYEDSYRSNNETHNHTRDNNNYHTNSSKQYNRQQPHTPENDNFTDRHSDNHTRHTPAAEPDLWEGQARSEGTAPPRDLRPKSHHHHASTEKSSSRDLHRDLHRRPDDDSGVAEMSPDDEYHRNSSPGRKQANQHTSRRDDYDALSKRLEADRFALDDETDEERRRKLDELEGRNWMDRQRWDEDQENRRWQAEEDRRREEEERRREEEMKRKQEEEEDARRRREEEEERRKRREEEEERQRREEEERNKAAQEEEERLRNDAKSPEEAEEDDPLKRNTESAKQRRWEEMERLLKEAEEARQARQEMEREREELVKKAKALQHKTTNRRNDARDMWKKKYFEEKKKTAPLEENSNRLRGELEALHRRLMNTLEGPKEKNHVIHTQPSQKNNYIIQCTKLQHDIEDIQRRVSNAKMKLTSEMKLRNQAQGELRALRAELAERKHTLVKSRQQQLLALTPRPPEHPRNISSTYGGSPPYHDRDEVWPARAAANPSTDVYNTSVRGF